MADVTVAIRGKIFWVTGLFLTVICVGLELVSNRHIYTEQLSTRATSSVRREVLVERKVIPQRLAESIDRENLEEEATNDIVLVDVLHQDLDETSTAVNELIEYEGRNVQVETGERNEGVRLGITDEDDGATVPHERHEVNR